MPTPDENAAILRPVWEALVSEAEARLLRVLDHATGGGVRLLIDRTEGFLDGARVGTIADESVEVAMSGLPAIVTQEQFNAYVLAALAALAAAGDGGGGTGGGKDYLWWSSGSSATDPEWLTHDGRLLRRAT